MAEACQSELRAFYILLLVGQYAQAINVLINSQYYIDAIHIATMLSKSYLGLCMSSAKFAHGLSPSHVPVTN
jgi:hypothetical protein